MSIREEAGFAYFMDYLERKSTEIKAEKIKNKRKIRKTLKISSVSLVICMALLSRVNHYWDISIGCLMLEYICIFTFALSIATLIGFELANKYNEAAGFSAWMSETLATINLSDEEEARKWLENFRTPEDIDNREE